MSTSDVASVVDEIVKPWMDKEGNLIMILHQIQNKFSYVPRDISFQVAERLRIPLARIYEVITFYNYFKLEAPGKHVVSVCLGTACYLKGSKAVVDTLHEEIGVAPGETTTDRRFHLQAVRCLGCCGQAPVMTVDQRIYGKLVSEQIGNILGEYSDTKEGVAGGAA